MPKVASPKSVVISFRLTEEINDALQETIDKYHPSMVKSTRQMARHVVIDFARGRLRYENPKDIEVSRDLMEIKPRPPKQAARASTSGQPRKRSR